ncbi:MAG: serine/threonine protein kinase [Polyangiaceae bacterium]|nr:serine/threonine protein kinase [Polyangiaceae bacterium]
MIDAGTTVANTPFRVERLLAIGGMAEVYLAREALLGGIERRVVLKRLRPQYRDDDELVTMFFDESRVGALVQHPNVVLVHSVLRCGQDCLIVMEYVAGPSLRQLLHAAATEPTGVLPGLDAAAIALTLAEAMDYVHRASDPDGRPLGVVHRDLNPSNVIMSRAGAVKIIDFGIARGENRVHETATGMLKGTPGYMAPEQLDADGRTDARTDVFSLGVVLYELFVGRFPFATDDLLKLPALVQSGSYPPAAVARPGVPAMIDALIRACMEPNPADRPQSMGEVGDALMTYLAASGAVPTLSRLAGLVDHLAPAGDGELARGPLAAAPGAARPDGGPSAPRPPAARDGDPRSTLVKRFR